MSLSAPHRVLLAAAAVAMAAAIAVVIDGRGGRDPESGDRRVTTTVLSATVAPAVSGHDLAGALSQTSAQRTSPELFDPDTLALVAAQQSVDTEQAWPLAIPGDDRTAWLFAGAKRLALVVPRTVVDPDRGPVPDAVSIFGARIADLAERPLIASQAGAGQRSRTLVLVPEGFESPRIVARDGDAAIREMPRLGRLYADRIGPDEQLIVGGQRIGPTEIE